MKVREFNEFLETLTKNYGMQIDQQEREKLLKQFIYKDHDYTNLVFYWFYGFAGSVAPNHFKYENVITKEQQLQIQQMPNKVIILNEVLPHIRPCVYISKIFFCSNHEVILDFLNSDQINVFDIMDYL
jgi:hypothetical protein